MIKDYRLNARKTYSVFALLILLSSCTTTSNTVPDRTTKQINTSFSLANLCNNPSEFNAFPAAEAGSLWSLCNTWYRNNPVPTLGKLSSDSPLDWQQACAVATGQMTLNGETPGEIVISETENEFLSSALGVSSATLNEKNYICYYAISDQDGDDILDYRINSVGRFIENDVDIDNDGITNIRDSEPTYANNENRSACGSSELPAHLALSCDSDTQWACDLQQKLYSDYDIAVVNRDYPDGDSHVFATLQTIYDVVHLVYGDNFSSHPGADENCSGIPTLKTIAFEQCPASRQTPWGDDPWNEQASCTGEDEWSTNAEAQAHNASVVFYDPGVQLAGFSQLGVFAHELAHSWTFAYDFQTTQNKALSTQNYWQCPNYQTQLEQLGWQFTPLPDDEIERQKLVYQNVLNSEYEIIQYDDKQYLLDGIELSTHGETLDPEFGDIEYSEGAIEYGLIGTYSLDPWEWYADVVQAYLFRTLEDHLYQYSSKRTAHQAREWLRARVLEEWPENQFYYPNLKQSIYTEFSENLLPISGKARDELTCRYIIYSDDFFFQPLIESQTPMGDWVTLQELKKTLRTDWQDVCGDGYSI